MLVEHSFVTTLEMPEVMSRAADFLTGLGFKLLSLEADRLEASRGRKRPNSPRVNLLPQAVRLAFDRGRVSVAASITPRGAGQSVHALLMTSLVRGLEKLLVDQLPPEQAAAEWQQVEATNPKLRTSLDYLGIGCLIVLGVLVLIVVIIAIVAATRK